MGFRDATTPWKIFYVASGLFLLTIIIVGICLAFLLKAPGVTVTGAYIYCFDFNNSYDQTGACAAQAVCTDVTSCRNSTGIDFNVIFLVNNPSISTCSFSAEIDVYDETRAPGTGDYLLATSYFMPNHLTNQGHLGKSTKGRYIANLKLKEPSNESEAGSHYTYANSLSLIASSMRRSCCNSCPVNNPDYSYSCNYPPPTYQGHQPISVRVKGKMHFSCLIQPQVNFEQVLILDSTPTGDILTR